MIHPPRWRGLVVSLAVSLANSGADGAGSTGEVAMVTFAGKTPSTPGRAPGGGGGSASPAGAAAAVRVGSVRGSSGRAVSARAVSGRGVSARAVSVRVGSRVDSLGRGRPANGAGAAKATVLFPFTLKVFTATG